MDTASEPRHGGSVPVRSSGKVRAMGPGLGSAALVEVSKTTGSSRQVRPVGPGLCSTALVKVSKTTVAAGTVLDKDKRHYIFLIKI